MASWLPEADYGNWAPADPKPPKRHKATPAEKRDLDEHFKNACCVSTGMPYQHLHHIAFRKADSGDDVIENLAPMTNEAHTRYHTRAPGWERDAAAIRKYVLSDNKRRHYAEKKLGERFNKRYPPLPNTDPQFNQDFQRIYKTEAK